MELGQKENFLNESRIDILQERTKYTQEKLLEDNQETTSGRLEKRAGDTGLARQKIENAGELIGEIEQEFTRKAQRRKKRSLRRHKFLK
ncbi:MAG: hypothetical protein ACLUUO_14490 [Sellimonas intestinalis]